MEHHDEDLRKFEELAPAEQMLEVLRVGFLTLNQEVEELKQQNAELIQRVETLEAGSVTVRVNPNLPWQDEAIKLAIQSMTKTAIAEEVGRTRESVSKFLNRPEVKEAIAIAKAKVME